MPDYTGGVTAALDSRSRRGVEDAQTKALMQQLAQAAQLFQQQQEQQKRQQQARAMLGDLLPQLAAMQGGGGGPQPQPPMPGQPSVPMMPPGGGAAPMPSMPPPPGAAPVPMPGVPPQGGMPPVGMPSMPPPPAQGQGAPMAKAGGPGAPMPGAGAPPAGAAPPMPPQPWQSLPKPPEGAPAGPGGLPQPPEDAVMPKQLISVRDLSKLLDAKGIKGEQAMDMLEQWKPFMDSQNKAELDAMKVQNQAQAAALNAYAHVIQANAAKQRADTGTAKLETVEKPLADAKAAKLTGKFGAGVTEKIDPADRESIAAQVATGQPLTQVVPGYGKNAVAARARGRADAIKLIMDENPGMTAAQAGRELAQRSTDFIAGRGSEVQLTKMLGATEQAVKQLDFNVDKVTEEMKKLPSNDLSPVLNALVRGTEKWTGNPAYSSLYFYMHAAAMESARILSGGQASIAQLHQGAAEEAKKWADIGLTPSMWTSVSKAMHDEGEARLKSYREANDGRKIKDRGPTPDAKSKGDYVEMRTTKDGRTLGKKADGTIEVVQ